MKYKILFSQFAIELKLADTAVCSGYGDDRVMARLAIEADRLDERGYILDNATVLDTIESAFDNGIIYKGSCEDICGAVIATVLGLDTDGRVTEVTVSIENDSGKVEGQWKTGAARPDFLRPATDEEVAAYLAKTPEERRRRMPC
jgi:hypothetical protein